MKAIIYILAIEARGDSAQQPVVKHAVLMESERSKAADRRPIGDRAPSGTRLWTEDDEEEQGGK